MVKISWTLIRDRVGYFGDGDMNKRCGFKSNAGLTMVELMMAAAIFSSSIVAFSGSMITIANHNASSEGDATATGFTRTIIEDMRGLSLAEIVDYEVPVDDETMGTVFIPGVGNAWVSIWAVVPKDDGNGREHTTWHLLGEGYPISLEDLPNPIELKLEVYKAPDSYDGHYNGSADHFTSSTMLSY